MFKFQTAYVSKWYDSGEDFYQAVKTGDVQARIGDRLEIEGLVHAYCHWAVVSEIAQDTLKPLPRWLRKIFPHPLSDEALCVGIMHFTGTSLSETTVEVQNIRSYDRKLRVNNLKDRQTKVLSPHQIRRNIYNINEDPSLIGKYNLLTNNCEDFVNFIRYGIRESDQISYYMEYISDVLIYYMAYSGDALFYLLLFGFLVFAWFANWYATMNLVPLLLLLYVLHIYEPTSRNLYVGVVLSYLSYFSLILFAVYTDWDFSSMFTVVLVVLAILVYLKNL